MGEKDYLASKSVYNEAKDEEGEVDLSKSKILACREDFFEIICSHHLLRQRVYAQNTWMSVKNSYCNISRDLCEKFVELCSC